MKTSFHFLVFKAFHAQRNRIRLNMVDEYGLSPGQPKVLRYISKHSDCKLKDIADECDVEPATVSKLLNSLESMKMLTREVDQSNKRALKLRITPRGLEALKKWDTHCGEVENISLNEFSEEERQQFEEYLSRMYRNLTGKEID